MQSVVQDSNEQMNTIVRDLFAEDGVEYRKKRKQNPEFEALLREIFPNTKYAKKSDDNIEITSEDWQEASRILADDDQEITSDDWQEASRILADDETRHGGKRKQNSRRQSKRKQQNSRRRGQLKRKQQSRRQNNRR